MILPARARPSVRAEVVVLDGPGWVLTREPRGAYVFARRVELACRGAGPPRPGALFGDGSWKRTTGSAVLGQLVRAVRRDRGLTPTQLARRLRLDPLRLSDLERGRERPHPHAPALTRILKLDRALVVALLDQWPPE